MSHGARENARVDDPKEGKAAVPWYRQKRNIILLAVGSIVALVVIICISLWAAGYFSQQEASTKISWNSGASSANNNVVYPLPPKVPLPTTTWAPPPTVSTHSTSNSVWFPSAAPTQPAPSATTGSSTFVNQTPPNATQSSISGSLPVPTATAGNVTGAMTNNTNTTGAPVPQPFRQVVNDCECVGALVDKKCYGNDLQAAMAASQTVKIANRVVVTAEIPLRRSISLQGVVCGRNASSIVANMGTDKQHTIFRVALNQIDVSIQGISFSRQRGDVSVLRNEEIDAEKEMSNKVFDHMKVVNLNVDNCAFTNFYTTTNGGAAIFLAHAGRVNIRSSTFTNNTVDTKGEKYGGSGAVWIFAQLDGSPTTISDSIFSQNEHKFPHGLGGALGISTISGPVQITNCKFQANKAPDGGAFYTLEVLRGTNMEITGCEFSDNESVERGWGSRGGAMTIQSVEGNVRVNGIFRNNWCHADRGGVIAANKLHPGASMTLGGRFIRNRSKREGAVYDLGMQGFLGGAGFVLEGGTFMQGNRNDNGDLVIRLESPGDNDVSINEGDYGGGRLSYAG